MSEDKIIVYGHDLVEEVMGNWTFAELTYAAMTGGRRPSSDEARMIDVLLTTFVDHGVTPSSLAARLTLLGAPEAMQGAIAAGLSGAGSRYLGTMQATAELLQSAISEHGMPTGDDGLASIARAIVERERAGKRKIPGLGHPEHKAGDPRTPKLLEIGRETGTVDIYSNLLLKIGDANAEISGRRLTVNAAGLSGAIVLDMGLPPVAARGLAVVSRAAGLVGAVLDEMQNPTAQAIWDGLR